MHRCPSLFSPMKDRLFDAGVTCVDDVRCNCNRSRLDSPAVSICFMLTVSSFLALDSSSLHDWPIFQRPNFLGPRRTLFIRFYRRFWTGGWAVQWVMSLRLTLQTDALGSACGERSGWEHGAQVSLPLYTSVLSKHVCYTGIFVFLAL